MYLRGLAESTILKLRTLGSADFAPPARWLSAFLKARLRVDRESLVARHHRRQDQLQISAWG